MALALFAGTIFCSAFLLFLIQPIASKHILPWFGGSAAVWAVCMSFFQALLLAGYAYADVVSRKLVPKLQVALHLLLLVIGFATLQVLADASWKPTGNEDPSLRILLMLAASIGLPYFLLSSTGPLVQSWVARSSVDTRVYRLFSLSNLASLIGLLAYPFVIEPRFALGQQAVVWTVVYAFYTLLCAAAAVMFLKRLPAPSVAWSPPPVPGPKERAWSPTLPPPEFVATQPSTFGDLVANDDARRDRLATPLPSRGERWRWFALSALGSWLLVATTNHLTRDVASIPFLWIVPLVLYLLTFVICFESDRWYRRSWLLLPVLLATGLCSYTLWAGTPGGSSLTVAIAIFSVGLFLQCVFLHGELAARRPSQEHLTRFYLMLSLGGAVGGALVSLVAPRVLPAYYELGFGYILLALIAFQLVRRQPLAAVACAAAVVGCAASLVLEVRYDHDGSRQLLRNFYGTLSTSDHDTDQPLAAYRLLRHGSVIHGEQYLAPERQREPTTYYGVTSGLGRAILVTRREGQRVGVIGLGAGTTAAYGKSGDVHRFYEINPQVIDIARSEFTFLSGTAAKTEMVLGDARLMLEQEAPQGYDVLAVDAFSGDSVPVHLITREALAVYMRHVRDGGIVAFHVTNRHLNLAPVVKQLANDAKLLAVLVHDPAENSALRRTDWVLVTRNAQVLKHTEILESVAPFPVIPGLGVWTDDFNNLFDVLK
jgi:predicted membrane-bound spermidine synthase